MAHKTALSYRDRTKQRVIAVLVERGLTRREIQAELLPMVREQTRPMVFSANVSGRRVPLPIHKQYKRLWYSIGRVMVDMGKEVDLKEDMPDDDTDTDEPTPEPAPITPKSETAEDYFLRRCREIEDFCNRRAAISEPLDEITMRPRLDGIRGIRAGISADAMLSAMALHWPDETRREAGIPIVDFEQESEPLGPGFHKMTGYVLKLAQARIPCMLVGPAGTGKSHIAKQVAAILKRDYAECPLTAGATPSWLLGSWTIRDYTPRPHLEMFAKGGVFNYEEIDAADPNMLLVTNQVLASDEFFNPVNGEKYEKHENFSPMSTANTFGLGANRAFTARERLDAATIDRWRMGRVYIAHDVELSEYIARNQ